jgi:hypothetical protein
MSRLVVVCVLVVVCSAVAWLHTSAAAGSRKSPAVLRVGDTVRIAGTKLGCAVAKRQGVTVVECVPSVRKRGSYATLAGDQNVSVVRFESSGVARTVFHAHQHLANPTICR